MIIIDHQKKVLRIQSLLESSSDKLKFIQGQSKTLMVERDSLQAELDNQVRIIKQLESERANLETLNQMEMQKSKGVHQEIIQ